MRFVLRVSNSIVATIATQSRLLFGHLRNFRFFASDSRSEEVRVNRIGDELNRCVGHQEMASSLMERVEARASEVVAVDSAHAGWRWKVGSANRSLKPVFAKQWISPTTTIESGSENRTRDRWYRYALNPYVEAFHHRFARPTRTFAWFRQEYPPSHLKQDPT